MIAYLKSRILYVKGRNQSSSSRSFCLVPLSLICCCVPSPLALLLPLHSLPRRDLLDIEQHPSFLEKCLRWPVDPNSIRSLAAHGGTQFVSFPAGGWEE